MLKLLHPACRPRAGTVSFAQLSVNMRGLALTIGNSYGIVCLALLIDRVL
jgi:hypothetical protein